MIPNLTADRHPLDRYRIDPPEGAAITQCPRHPSELLVFAEIPVLSLTGEGEETATRIRGWTCRRCFRGRSFVVEERAA